jgi:hypothetical protein
METLDNVVGWVLFLVVAPVVFVWSVGFYAGVSFMMKSDEEGNLIEEVE